VLAAIGEPERAEVSYAASLGLDGSDAAVWVKRGRNLVKLARAAEGERAFRDALARESANGEAHFELGKLAAARGDAAAAIESFRQAVAAAPRLKEAWYQLGVALRRAGREAESAAALEEFRKLQ
jgi:superkiller protein 3